MFTVVCIVVDIQLARTTLLLTPIVVALCLCSSSRVTMLAVACLVMYMQLTPTTPLRTLIPVALVDALLQLSYSASSCMSND